MKRIVRLTVLTDAEAAAYLAGCEQVEKEFITPMDKPLTVSELIAELQKQPPQAIAVITNDARGHQHTILAEDVKVLSSAYLGNDRSDFYGLSEDTVYVQVALH